jgi:hypothetical protein
MLTQFHHLKLHLKRNDETRISAGAAMIRTLENAAADLKATIERGNFRCDDAMMFISNLVGNLTMEAREISLADTSCLRIYSHMPVIEEGLAEGGKVGA